MYFENFSLTDFLFVSGTFLESLTDKKSVSNSKMKPLTHKKSVTRPKVFIWQTFCLSVAQFCLHWQTFCLAVAHFCMHWQTKSLSALKKNERKSLKISIADRLFVCQWLQKTKKIDRKIQKSLIDRLFFRQPLTFPAVFYTTDRQKVCQSMTFGLSDRLFVCQQ